MKRRTVKRIFYFLIFALLAFTAGSLLYMRLTPGMDTKEADYYYDLLSGHEKPAPGMIFDLGIKADDTLEDSFKKLMKIYGFKGSGIILSRTNNEKPPAKIIDHGYGALEIQLSKKVVERREQINVLIHELCHIYVWHLDRSVYGKCDEEKLTDAMGVYIGLGVFILNGLTDEVFFLPGGEYGTEKKFFGYLKPEEFGYLVARFAMDHNIPEATVMQHLNPTGKKYFSFGLAQLKRSQQ